MELTTEINKVFGTEMAKLISSTISEEELKAVATKAWNELTCRQRDSVCTYGNIKSDINELVKKELLIRIEKTVNEILDSEEGKETIKEDAERLIQNIRTKSEEKIVESISDRVAQMTAGYQGYGIRSMIEKTVADMIK